LIKLLNILNNGTSINCYKLFERLIQTIFTRWNCNETTSKGN